MEVGGGCDLDKVEGVRDDLAQPHRAARVPSQASARVGDLPAGRDMRAAERRRARRGFAASAQIPS